MSKIDDLIQELCPDGVEYKELGSITTIQRGASPRPISRYVTEESDGVPWIKIGDVDTGGKYITQTKQRITQEGASKSRFLKSGSFVLSNSMSFGRPYILKIDGCIHDGWLSLSDFENSYNTDFLYHLLRSSNIQTYWSMEANSGSVSNLNSKIVSGTMVPVPPIEVQEEIVRVLDSFAELEARRRQYVYYRDQLLTFNKPEIERERASK